MTTLVVLQPGYLPWIGYFDLLQKADVFVHYDDVQFDKHGWRNRNRLKGSRGAVWLTVPVRHSGRAGQKILEVEIDDRQNWQRKHLATVRQLYARAPYLDSIFPNLTDILDRPWRRLVELDLAVVDWLARELGITTLRYQASELNICGDRNERLLNLCRHFGATTYLSGNAARDYLDVPQFSANGIRVVWHDYAHPAYGQQHGEFVSHLSLLDLILNVGPNSLAVLTHQHKLRVSPIRP